jgi:hypothetical protein
MYVPKVSVPKPQHVGKTFSSTKSDLQVESSSGTSKVLSVVSDVLEETVVGDIPNGYTSDVVLNQQARVAHQGGMADCLPGGPVAGSPWQWRTQELMADP